MIVTCDSCKTKFNLDPSRIRGHRSKVRCSQCGNVFVVDQEEEEVLIHVDLPEDEELEELEDKGMDFSSPYEAPQKSSRFDIKARPRRMVLLGSGVLVLLAVAYWLTSLLTSGSSDSGEQKVKGQVDVPAVTILDNTRAYFLENPQAGGQIFVIEGEVSNESGKMVSFILLEGKIYKTNNQVAQSQRSYAGNAISRDELTKLNVNELQNRMMNREGKDLANVRVPPSRRVPFMLVFHNLPEFGTLSDYSVEVISAKAD